jgi:hypothetical protein
MPRAPPPPSTSPTDLPHILLARREKSFIWGNRCDRTSVLLPRYFWIPLWTLSLRFFSAATASGSLWTGAGFGRGTTKPYSSNEFRIINAINDWTNGQLDMDMLMNPWAILTTA